MSQVFYRKWRPQTLADVVGQPPVTRTLLNALSSGRVAHAYLFCGPRGTGKTSTGRILAKAVNCLNNRGSGEPCNTCSICQQIAEGRAFDVIEIDAASNRGIDEIRDLREKVNYAPNEARFKVYIIDEVHMLTTGAANALLKTLEEPPPHVIFILATTEAHKVLPTILSRCQRFDFRRLSQTDVINKLNQICTSEGIRIEPETLRLIARAATGSLRDAENLLQQLTTYYGSEIKLEQVQAILGVTGDWRAKELVRHIVNNDIAAGIATINSVNRDGVDLRHFNRELVQYFRALLLMKTGSPDAVDLTADDKKELETLSEKTSLSQTLKAVKLFGQLELGLDNYSTLPLELALVDCLLPAEPKVSTVASPTEPESATPLPQKPKAKPERVVTPEPATQTQKPVMTASVTPRPPNIPQPALPVTEKATSAPTEPTNELERLKRNWRQFINEAPADISRTPAAALLRSARPKSIEDNTVVLSFKYPYYKEKMEILDNQKIAERIISNFLGRPCRVVCVYEPEASHLVQAALKAGAQIIDSEEK